MFKVSDAFIAELISGAEIVTKVNLYYAGELLAEDIPMKSGSITDDSNSLIRRRCNVVLEPAEDWSKFIPGYGKNMEQARGVRDFGLWPVGTECKIWQGIKFNDSSMGIEWVPMGTFRIANPKVSATTDQITVSFDGYDASRKISRARFSDAFNIQYKTDVPSACKQIILAQCSWLMEDDFDFSEVESMVSAAGDLDGFLFVPNLIFDRDDDPWKQAVDIATSSGMYLYIGLDDKIKMKPIPDLLSDPPEFSYDEGEDCILTDVDRDIDDEQGYNGVIVTGENSTNATVVREEIWETNVASPLYYDPAVPDASIYGPNPYFLTSQSISGSYQAILAGKAQFFRLTGIIESLNISAIPMFAHESMDLIHIKHERSQIDDNFILDQFTMGLGPEGRLSGRTRARRIA